MNTHILLRVLNCSILKEVDMFLLKIHIIQRAKTMNKSTPSNIKKIIEKYERLYIPDTFIRFSFMKDGFSTILNAKALSPNGILLSPEWAARLALFNNEETHNAFLITLGHEMTHNEIEFSLKGVSRKNRKFVNRVNEVHADFGAAQKMSNSSREILIQSIKYKLSLKKKDIEDSSHPSWARRLEYATNYNFDETLIRKIAADAAASASLLQPVIAFFQPIVLS